MLEKIGDIILTFGIISWLVSSFHFGTFYPIFGEPVSQLHQGVIGVIVCIDLVGFLVSISGTLKKPTHGHNSNSSSRQ